jgi:hypothetical protein
VVTAVEIEPQRIESPQTIDESMTLDLVESDATIEVLYARND